MCNATDDQLNTNELINTNELMEIILGLMDSQDRLYWPLYTTQSSAPDNKQGESLPIDALAA